MVGRFALVQLCDDERGMRDGNSIFSGSISLSTLLCVSSTNKHIHNLINIFLKSDKQDVIRYRREMIIYAGRKCHYKWSEIERFTLTTRPTFFLTPTSSLIDTLCIVAEGLRLRNATWRCVKGNQIPTGKSLLSRWYFHTPLTQYVSSAEFYTWKS